MRVADAARDWRATDEGARLRRAEAPGASRRLFILVLRCLPPAAAEGLFSILRVPLA